MLRVAVIAYLSLATVLGPSLCCCNARQLFSLVETSGSHCCGKPSTGVSASAHNHSHKHHHGHEHVAENHFKSPAPVERSPQTPCEHDNQDCPCGNRQASLIATATSEGTSVQALELQSQFFNQLAVDLPVLPEFDVKAASATAHIRPADLYGREMLRAYQTMRC
jgi:hypothetical protein